MIGISLKIKLWRNVMKITVRGILFISLLLISFLAYYVILYGYSQNYSFGQQGATDIEITNDGELLYVTYFEDDAIVEVDVNTMLENRRFSVPMPTTICLDGNESYIYSSSDSWPGRLYKIRLSDGQTSFLTLEGEIYDLAIDKQDNRLWTVQLTWPQFDELFTETDAYLHPNTGRLTEIDLDYFQVSRYLEIEPLPTAVWYSQYSNKIYVVHQMRKFEPYNPSSYGPADSLRYFGNPIIIYGLERENLYKIGEFYGGHHDIPLTEPYRIGNWDDSGRYLAIPSPNTGRPEFSLEVIDTTDDSVENYISFPGFPNGNILTTKYVKKVNGEDVLWATILFNTPFENAPLGERYVARIDTATLDYEIFTIDNGNYHLGDFTVAPDGNTLYFTVPSTGEVIEWSPD